MFLIVNIENLNEFYILYTYTHIEGRELKDKVIVSLLMLSIPANYSK